MGVGSSDKRGGEVQKENEGQLYKNVIQKKKNFEGRVKDLF